MVRVAASPVKTPTKVTAAPTTTPSKLRRKISVETTALQVNQRLVEYFIVVSSTPRWMDAAARKSPARTPKSENIHLPMQQADYTFSPSVTARFPPLDYPDNPLNPMIVQFCYPHSDSILPSDTYIMPRIHHFVLTNDKGTKVYGTCLTIYEEYTTAGKKDPYTKRHEIVESSDSCDIEVTAVTEEQPQTLYIPRVLCILSTWPYLMAFREYLTQLYKLATTTHQVMDAPLERYIQNLCLEIPAPPPGAFEIELSILDSNIKFWAPPAKLPVAYVAIPYASLFECLDLNNILTIWKALLGEEKLLLISSQYSLLTVCCEVLCSLLFPLQWSHLYIPLLPRFLSPMLDAPIPFLVGVVRDNWVHAEQHLCAEETVVVDLDSNTVTVGSQVKLVQPPYKKYHKLEAALQHDIGDLFWKVRGLSEAYRQVSKGKLSLHELHRRNTSHIAGWKERLRNFDEAFSMAYTPDSPNLVVDEGEENEQSQWERVQEAFLRFFVSTFRSYRKFLHLPHNTAEVSILDPSYHFPSTSINATNRRSFDCDGFIAWQRAEDQEFYRKICLTQQFDDFITKRLYSPGEPDVIFFDQSIDSKNNRSKLRVKKVETPFLLNAKAHKVLKTVRAVDPSTEGLNTHGRYRYESWPSKFDASLFGEPRPIPSIITAEFDRQSALVARLRAIDDSGPGVDLLRGDFDASPEVATFTLFFFTYGAVIGLDWQAYQEKRKEDELASMLADHHDNLNQQVSDDADKSDPMATSTIAATTEEGSLSNACHPSAMLLSLPQWSLESCLHSCEGYTEACERNVKHVCERIDKGDIHDEYLLLWNPTPENQACTSNLLDMDENHLAEYEEAKAIASAQLDLAFEALSTMGIRGLNTDPDAFKSLMEACGRCGNTDRAIELIQEIKRNGFVADSEMYSCFLNAFAKEEQLEANAGAEQPLPSLIARRRSSDAYSSFLKKKLKQSKEADAAVRGIVSSQQGEDSSELYSDSTPSDHSDNLNSSIMSDIYNAVFSPSPKQKSKKKRKHRRSSSVALKEAKSPVTDRVLKQVVLGENLITYLYPNLSIDTNSDSCPRCSTTLTEDDVAAGWKACEFQDFTTECPQCQHRFVPHFTVQCSSSEFSGTQGKSTPLYCEFLSPWVLRKELENVVHGIDGIDGMLNPQWRDGTDIRATLWWNLVVAFNRYRLPVSFLLQGSFHNRLISPTPE